MALAASIRIGLKSAEARPSTVYPSLSSTSTSAPCLIKSRATCQTNTNQNLSGKKKLLWCILPHICYTIFKSSFVMHYIYIKWEGYSVSWYVGDMSNKTSDKMPLLWELKIYQPTHKRNDRKNNKKKMEKQLPIIRWRSIYLLLLNSSTIAHSIIFSTGSTNQAKAQYSNQ